VSDPFLWVRAYEDIAPGDGTRWVGWNTIYEGFSMAAALEASRLPITFNEYVIMDSQYPGNPQWEPRQVWNRPNYGAQAALDQPNVAEPPPADREVPTNPKSQLVLVGVFAAILAGLAWVFRKA